MSSGTGEFFREVFQMIYENFAQIEALCTSTLTSGLPPLEYVLRCGRSRGSLPEATTPPAATAQALRRIVLRSTGQAAPRPGYRGQSDSLTPSA